MKFKIILTIIFIFTSYAFSFAQIKDSVSQINDYSNKRQVDISLMLRDNKQTLESTLVIINSKIICRINDKYFKELDKKNILNIKIIVDENSKSTITKILLITTN